MHEKTCCSRFLLDSKYDGDRRFWDHERYDGHQWVDAGETCCPTPAAQYTRVVCWCRAQRWVKRP